ncbi:MAG: hypothetical protein ACAI35_02300 [Candidatus Methylacidiphilales bacterium]
MNATSTPGRGRLASPIWRPAARRRARVHAFSLVEVTLAIGVTAFCLISLFGLLLVGIKSSQAAMEQTNANGMLSTVAADLRATSPTFPAGQATITSQFQIPIPAHPVTTSPAPFVLYLTTDGRPETAFTPDSRYRLTVTFLPNGSNTAAATYVSLHMHWPAAKAEQSQADSVVESFLALDRN